MTIGLISDTHSYLDDKVFDYFSACDEIWHAGDIGDIKVMEQLEAFKPVRAVFGNIDDRNVRSHYPEDLHFACEGLNVWITHIGGYPPRYNPSVLKKLKSNSPDLFICGHSHILRVMHDKQFTKPLLYLNPGAAGKHGFHSVRTLLRFSIIDQKISAMEAIELGKRA